MPFAPSFSIQQILSQRQTLAQWMAMRQSPILELSQEGLLERQLQELRSNPVVERTPSSISTESYEALRDTTPSPSTTPTFDNSALPKEHTSLDNPAPLSLGEHGSSLASDDVADFFVQGYNNEYAPDPDADEHYTYRINSIRAHESLEDHLLQQLHTADLSPSQTELSLAILQSLDPNGYLASPLADIAQACGTTLPQATNALRFVQTLDPPGIAARSLAERFLLQLQAEGLDDVLAADFLRQRPDLFRPRDLRVPSLYRSFQFTEQDLASLTSTFHCSLPEARLALDDIAALDPAPADAFIPPEQDVIATDATVVELNGQFVVLNPDTPLPDDVLFHINPEFQALAENPQTDPEFRSDLKQKIAQAEELSALVHGRNALVRTVAAAIVARQQDFFRQRSLAALHPMSQKDIAHDISSDERQFDESQISRACNGKWMKTPLGNLKFSDFFSRGVSGHSNRSVKDRVRQLIDSEDPSAPLSDSALSKILASENITLSREGVKKYRNELHIPSSTQRKRT